LIERLVKGRDSAAPFPLVQKNTGGFRGKPTIVITIIYALRYWRPVGLGGLGMRFIKKILERGTITIPSDVREAMGVDEGDIVEFQIVRIVKRSDEPPANASRAAATPTQPASPANPAPNGEI
jgi:AbrB family looped-hinge helix DNA binding protein